MFSTATLLETLLAYWESRQQSCVTSEILTGLGFIRNTSMCVSWAQAKGADASNLHLRKRLVK